MSAVLRTHVETPAPTRPRLRSHASPPHQHSHGQPRNDARPLGAGNQALQRHLQAGIAFPHEARLRALMPVAMPLSARLDPAACARRGAVVYTEGTVSYFHKPDPDLHVAGFCRSKPVLVA